MSRSVPIDPLGTKNYRIKKKIFLKIHNAERSGKNDRENLLVKLLDPESTHQNRIAEIDYVHS